MGRVAQYIYLKKPYLTLEILSDMAYWKTYLAVFLLTVLAKGEMKEYLCRVHSVFKSDFDLALVDCAPNPMLDLTFTLLISEDILFSSSGLACGCFNW